MFKVIPWSDDYKYLTAHEDHLNGIYLHGDLAMLHGMDLVVTDRVTHFKIQQAEAGKKYPVWVHGYGECVLYLYKRQVGVDMLAGYIVDPAETEAVAHAEERMVEQLEKGCVVAL